MMTLDYLLEKRAMKKNEIISALEGVAQENLEGTSRQKEITVQFINGVPVRLIAEKFGLSTSRVRQIAA